MSAAGQPPRARTQRTSTTTVTGLDLQPGEALAAQVSVNAGVMVESAARISIGTALAQDGEVSEPAALGTYLGELFDQHRLPRRVRVGLAMRSAVMRTVELPPIENPKDLELAVRMQAAEYIALPASELVSDYHVVGHVDTPQGPRTRVLVVAAPKATVDRLLEALRRARLKPVGVDLSAFALIRALHSPTGAAEPAPTLYAHISGVSTLAIARGTTCELTRPSPISLEMLAARIAERGGIPIDHARERLRAAGRSWSDQLATLGAGETNEVDRVAHSVLEGGVAELADDLRNTIEFYARQVGGAPISEVVLSGPAVMISGFREALEQRMGIPLRPGAPRGQPHAAADVPLASLAIAAGLAVEEGPA